jgi:hypothetical protein
MINETNKPNLLVGILLHMLGGKVNITDEMVARFDSNKYRLVKSYDPSTKSTVFDLREETDNA